MVRIRRLAGAREEYGPATVIGGIPLPFHQEKGYALSKADPIAIFSKRATSPLSKRAKRMEAIHREAAAAVHATDNGGVAEAVFDETARGGESLRG